MGVWGDTELQDKKTSIQDESTGTLISIDLPHP